jgi:tetratricopeptide (TPR) repeat protein
MKVAPSFRRHVTTVVGAFAILSLVALLYWPTTHGGFVWDDTTSLYDEAWLRTSSWRDFVLRNFNGWTDYFRPLVVLLFVLETHAFDAAPEPMHVVSLGMHLADTLLIGLLTCKLHRSPRHLAWAGAAMLFYGLHPALIEPVDWVGCQFELAVVFFMLLGLLLNASVASAPWRACAVGASFFCASGFKEAAAVFPIILVLFDLMATRGDAWPAVLRAAWQRQRLVYGAVAVAGATYLMLRHAALGHLLGFSDALPALARAQKISLTYLEYWRLIIWPMSAIGPIHPFDETTFMRLSPATVADDALAFGIACAGLYGFYRRRPWGGIVLAVSAALLPVLNIAPVALSESLYHDRYAATAIAMVCVLAPKCLAALYARATRLVRFAAAAIAMVWLAFAIVNIRVTVPLWADELGLWQWATTQHPESIDAKDLLLMAYMRHSDYAHATELADKLVSTETPCLVCMLNAANLAIRLRDEPRARHALDVITKKDLQLEDLRHLPTYILTRGELLELQGDLEGAEATYRDAVTSDPFGPQAQMSLALVLARRGKLAEARSAADKALELFPPDQRQIKRRQFERVAGSLTEDGTRERL